MNKKKISIVTFHNAHNYGAALQVYALTNMLKKNGKYDVNIIDYRKSNIENNYKIIRFYGKNPIKSLKRLIGDFIYLNKNYKRYRNFEKFKKEKLTLSNKVYWNNDKIDVKSDVLITGSDQVWNIQIVGELSDVFTLNFGDEKVKRISYAASVGDKNNIINNPQVYKEKLSKLDYISVREEDAKNELTKIIDKDIQVVLDPTLLLSQDDWNKEIKNCTNNINEKYILAYMVEQDKEYVKIVNELSKRTGLKVVHFGKRNPGYINVLKSVYTEGPLEFMNYIKNAEFVVATSFHATVFSIIFNKKFFIIPHKKTGARVTNLLDKLEIKNRNIKTLEEFKKLDYNMETNWNKVNKKLEEEKIKSINWLEKAINT